MNGLCVCVQVPGPGAHSPKLEALSRISTGAAYSIGANLRTDFASFAPAGPGPAAYSLPSAAAPGPELRERLLDEARAKEEAEVAALREERARAAREEAERVRAAWWSWRPPRGWTAPWWT
jgi:hypothetical protein